MGLNNFQAFCYYCVSSLGSQVADEKSSKTKNVAMNYHSQGGYFKIIIIYCEALVNQESQATFNSEIGKK